VSELRIRSEPPASAGIVELWQPRSAEAPPDDGDDAPFMPLLMALEAALGEAFACPVSVHPGRSLAAGAPDVAPDLAALLATVRLGGDPARPSAAGGVTTARHADLLAQMLHPALARLWPVASRRDELIVDVLATNAPGGNVVGSIRLRPPPRPMPAPPPQPLGTAALALPLRLRVRLAEDMLPLAMLLPLRPGLVIPVNAGPDMPLHLGDHRVGTATLAPLPDGRQQASITAIDITPAGERT
jgi:hypothetical protein